MGNRKNKRHVCSKPLDNAAAGLKLVKKKAKKIAVALIDHLFFSN